MENSDDEDDSDYYNELIISRNQFKLYFQKLHKFFASKSQYNKCFIKGCKEIGCYNYYNKYINHLCSKHKLKDMIKFGPKKCINEICFKYPTFNYSGKKKGIYCYEHRLLNMTNVISKRCKTHLCDMIISSKYKGYCFYCYSNMFPEKCINYKNKECRVVDYVKNNFDNLTWVYDKKIQDGCSTRRPDLFLDLGYQIIIIEIDENQHLNYESICENKRIMLLSQDVNHRPIIFIRFNPDDYIKDGCKIPSCWTTTKSKGFIKLKNEFEWNNRLEVLKNEIIFWINPSNKIDKIIHIIELFFDS